MLVYKKHMLYTKTSFCIQNIILVYKNFILYTKYTTSIQYIAIFCRPYVYYRIYIPHPYSSQRWRGYFLQILPEFIIELTLNGVGLIFWALDSAIPFELDCVEVDVENFALGGSFMLWYDRNMLFPWELDCDLLIDDIDVEGTPSAELDWDRIIDVFERSVLYTLGDGVFIIGFLPLISRLYVYYINETYLKSTWVYKLFPTFVRFPLWVVVFSVVVLRNQSKHILAFCL